MEPRISSSSQALGNYRRSYSSMIPSDRTTKQQIIGETSQSDTITETRANQPLTRRYDTAYPTSETIPETHIYLFDTRIEIIEASLEHENDTEQLKRRHCYELDAAEGVILSPVTGVFVFTVGVGLAIAFMLFHQKGTTGCWRCLSSF